VDWWVGGYYHQNHHRHLPLPPPTHTTTATIAPTIDRSQVMTFTFNQDGDGSLSWTTNQDGLAHYKQVLQAYKAKVGEGAGTYMHT
jgi:hypothetical protein